MIKFLYCFLFILLTILPQTKAFCNTLSVIRDTQMEQYALTGVKNKRAFEEKKEEIEQSLAAGSIKEFGIIVCDLNGLKVI